MRSSRRVGPANSKVSLDTNILVRLATRDDPVLAAAAERLVQAAQGVVITLPALCEFAWVMRSFYRIPAAELAKAIGRLVETRDVAVDRAAVDAGLVFLRNGADFADGVIAHLGQVAGAERFVSFDRAALAAARGAGLVAISPLDA